MNTCEDCNIRNWANESHLDLFKSCNYFRNLMECDRHTGLNWLDDCWHPIGTILVTREKDE